jgi:hypothetical protein
MAIHPGDCVAIPDGRVARVRDHSAKGWRVRVRRTTSRSHQFLVFPEQELKPVECPKGWMSPAGYNRYLQVTLEKMRQRQKK